MPEIINVNGVDKPVATEEELLEFANKARAAGGVNILEALLPSVPESPSHCLIANALNFDCRVDRPAYSDYWSMFLPFNMEDERVVKIAVAINCEIALDTASDRIIIQLPEHIGNAAEAFDSGEAFQLYDRDF